MRTHLFLILAFTVLMSACSEGQNLGVEATVTGDTIQKENEEDQTQIDEDCVFDTSTYQFTTEALFKYSPKIKYRWDTSLKAARVRLDNGDSLILHIGGCNHFGFQATLLTSVNFADTSVLFNKTTWIAKTFFYHGFEKKIPELISKGHIRLSDVDNGVNSKTYIFDDPDNTVTNLVLDGFTFEKRGNKTLIELGVYIN